MSNTAVSIALFCSSTALIIFWNFVSAAIADSPAMSIAVAIPSTAVAPVKIGCADSAVPIPAIADFAPPAFAEISFSFVIILDISVPPLIVSTAVPIPFIAAPTAPLLFNIHVRLFIAPSATSAPNSIKSCDASSTAAANPLIDAPRPVPLLICLLSKSTSFVAPCTTFLNVPENTSYTVIPSPSVALLNSSISPDRLSDMVLAMFSAAPFAFTNFSYRSLYASLP